ncbi:MAG: transposase [Bryobacterales bacterium]|jgi:putative transposase|nr:transposase [Bryobacterales bacterium]
MKKSRYSEEQMHRAVRQMEAGRTAEEVSREVGVSKATLYSWKSKLGGLELSEAKRLQALEDENRRLKQLVADLSLDREALKWLIEKNGWSSQPGARR